MKICKKCNTEFKSWIVIDDVFHSLSARKYCLICSPFNQHNTRHPDYVRTGRNQIECNKICKLCDRIITGRGTVCSMCASKFRRYRLKRALVDYKGGKCEDCGWSGHIAGFQFHHVDPSQKDFQVSKIRTLEKAKIEVDKCALLCSTCHDIRHTTQDNRFLKYVEEHGILVGLTRPNVNGYLL